MFECLRFYDLRNKQYTKDIEIKFSGGQLTITTGNTPTIIERHLGVISKPKYDYIFENDLICLDGQLFIAVVTELGVSKLRGQIEGVGSVTKGIHYKSEPKFWRKDIKIGPVWENLDLLDKLPKSEQQRVKRMLKQ